MIALPSSRSLLLIALAGCTSSPTSRTPSPGPRPRSPVAGGPVIAPRPLNGEPLIRVGIVVDRDSASVSATGQFRVLSADGGVIAVVDSGRAWTAWRGEPGQVRLTRPDRSAPLNLPTPVIIRSDGPATFVTVAGRRYRGELVISLGSTGVTVVNAVPMEAYLLSVVALELGFRNPTDREAVMAQAVAARTYAVRFRGRREALGFDVYPTDADQVYTGVDAESPEVADAVVRTAGQILTYRGEPIQALFHSTCGWSTEASDLVYRNGPPIPYLRAVSDRFGSGPADYYCAISPRFRWREVWDAATLSAVVAQNLPAVSGGGAATYGRITDIRASRTTPTGRVAELTITTTDGAYTVPQGRIREVLRPASGGQLYSTMLQLHVERNGESLVRVTAAGAGFGHGVGMCQFGAVGRARAGQDYRRILTTYYHDARVESIY